jgi:trk system potassium uptake protein TrkA
LGIDVIISPTQLAAKEIQKLIKRSVVTDVFDFDEGRFSLLGITLDDASPMVNFTVGEIDAKHPEMEFRPISILRGDNTIIPRSGTILKRSDHIYFISPKEGIEDLLNLIGKQPVHVKNIMIIGGGELTVQCARLLEKEFRLTIVEKEKERCKNLAEHLNHTLILRGDPSNVELLKEEGLSRMDAFIALTPNTETNIITSLVAEQCGVFKTIALVDNVYYFHISQNIGVDTLINKKLIAANNVFRYVRKGKIEAITSLHGVDAEVIEFVIDKENKLTRSRLKDLRFPTKSVVGGVIRGEENLVPNGEFQFKKDDKVIVFAQNEAIAQVEELFR